MGEFGVEKLLVEEGLVETFCEAWYRQWAVPGATSKWGGPPGCAMPPGTDKNYVASLLGPLVDDSNLRAEAKVGPAKLLLTGDGLNAAGWSRVEAGHSSVVAVRDMPLSWPSFETKQMLSDRMLRTVFARAEKHTGESLVFVSHGGPTTYTFEKL